MTQAILIALITAVSSSGVCSIILYIMQRRDKRKDTHDEKQEAMTKLLMGIARNIILEQGSAHIEAGWISRDDYDDLNKYLYQPYKKLGGNGTAEKIMREVEELPFNQPKANQEGA